MPSARGICPQCGKKVFSKCGEINIWHWSHFKDENCETWSEPESFWHKHWKMTFGKDNSEIVIEKDGKKHRADILTNERVVIELQNSPIKSSVIKAREDFYGCRMLWVINGLDFKENFIVTTNKRLDYTSIQKLDQYNFKKDQKPKLHWLLEEKFIWNYARKSWREVKNPAFIDFGGESLFWVKDGMGWKHGRGNYVSKEKFIKKYGGNYDYFCQKTDHTYKS